MSTKLKIYVACAIHGAPGEFGFRNKVVAALHQANERFEVVKFYSDHSESERVELNIYEFDMAQVSSAHVVLTILDKPSTGVGMELREAAISGIPALVCSRNPDAVSDITRHYLVSRRLPEAFVLPGSSEDDAVRATVERFLEFARERFPI